MKKKGKEIKKVKLDNLNVQQLIGLIEEMQAKFDVVDDFLQVKFAKDYTDLLQKYKHTISMAWGLDGEFQFEPAHAYEAVEKFRKLNPSLVNMAEILLHFVTEALGFINDCGDIGAETYNDLYEFFEEALQILKKEGLLQNFKPQLVKIVNDCENIGYGFCDDMSDLFSKYFEN